MTATVDQSARQEIDVNGVQSLRRIYVIDDEIQVLAFIEIQLKAAGFEVLTFSSPETFLRQFSSLARGVVLSDQRMPHANGLSVQRRLNDRPNEFQLILMSGFPETRTAV